MQPRLPSTTGRSSPVGGAMERCHDHLEDPPGPDAPRRGARSYPGRHQMWPRPHPCSHGQRLFIPPALPGAAHADGDGHQREGSMSKPAFTPGPWQTDAECGDESVLGPDGAMVADCAIFGMRVNRTEHINRANARL